MVHRALPVAGAAGGGCRRTLAKSLLDSGLPADFADRYADAMAEPGALTGALNWYRGIPPPLRLGSDRSRFPRAMSGAGRTSLSPELPSN